MLSKNIRSEFLLPPFKVKFSILRNEKKKYKNLKQPQNDSYKKQNERVHMLLPLVTLSNSLIC